MNGFLRYFSLLLLFIYLVILPLEAAVFPVGPEVTYAPYVDQQVLLHGMYLDIDNTTPPASPIGQTNQYTDLDSNVIQFLDVSKMHDGDIIEWKFRSPKGEVVSDLSIRNRFKGNFSKTVFYCHQPVRYFLTQPGQWSVSFSINGKEKAMDTFTILMAIKTTGSPTPIETISTIPTVTPTVNVSMNERNPEAGLPMMPILGLILIGVIAVVAFVALSSRAKQRSATLPQSSSSSPSLLLNIPHDVFISYSHLDKPIADAIVSTLEGKQIRCWIAPRDVLPGSNYQEAIIDAINTTRIMVLVFSSHSNTSPHVIRELTKALSQGVIIIPFRIEDVPLSKSMEYIISLPHWLDAVTPPVEKHIEELTNYVGVLLKQMKEKQ